MTEDDSLSEAEEMSVEEWLKEPIEDDEEYERLTDSLDDPLNSVQNDLRAVSSISEIMSEYRDLSRSLPSALDIASTMSEFQRKSLATPYSGLGALSAAHLAADMNDLRAVPRLADLPTWLSQMPMRELDHMTNSLALNAMRDLQPLYKQSLALPSLAAFDVMPATRLAANLTELSGVGHIETITEPPEPISTELTTSSTGEQPASDSFGRSTTGELAWGYLDWLEVYYCIASHYVDVALAESGVHDLSARQRAGICLTGAIALSAHPDGLTVPSSAVVMAFIYTVLQDLSE